MCDQGRTTCFGCLLGNSAPWHSLAGAQRGTAKVCLSLIHFTAHEQGSLADKPPLVPPPGGSLPSERAALKALLSKQKGRQGTPGIRSSGSILISCPLREVQCLPNSREAQSSPRQWLGQRYPGLIESGLREGRGEGKKAWG